MTLGGLVAVSPTARAEQTIDLARFEGPPRGFGLGIVLGEPAGVSWALRNGGPTVLQGAVGWSALDTHLHLTADYLFNLVDIKSPDAPDVEFPFYVGMGATVRLDGDWDLFYDHDPALGFRVPIGLAVVPQTVPIDVFIEGVPVIGLIRTPFELGWEAGIGARFYPF